MEGATTPRLCELIYRNLLVSKKPGTSKFADFVQDKRQMAVDVIEEPARDGWNFLSDFDAREMPSAKSAFSGQLVCRNHPAVSAEHF